MARELMLRQQLIMSSLKTDANRMVAANKALGEGNVDLACRLYLRVAASRPPHPGTVVARARLAQLRQDAEKKLKELESKLDRREGASASGQSSESQSQFEKKLLIKSDLMISSFAEDNQGEIYVIHYDGEIYKIVPAEN